MSKSPSTDTTRLQSPQFSGSGHANSRWAIVLAGGNGDRMRPFIQGWLGEPRPKQYCTFVGKRSMLRHTIDRAAALVPTEHIVTIVGKGHRSFLRREPQPLPGRVIEQPKDCGTAAGIFLPATYIMEEDPNAVVLICPSDHFVYPEPTFLCHALGACLLAQSYKDSLILLGAPATRPETDYGWIKPSRGAAVAVTGGAAWTLSAVESFQEKPEHDEAAELLAQGCLWNTMIVATTVKALWGLGWQLLPRMMERFHAFQQVLREVRSGKSGPQQETEALHDAYLGMKSYDFSRDILRQATQWTRVLPMKGIVWCDWGRPERIKATMDRLKLRPAYPPHSFDILVRTPGKMVSENWIPRDSLAVKT